MEPDTFEVSANHNDVYVLRRKGGVTRDNPDDILKLPWDEKGPIEEKDLSPAGPREPKGVIQIYLRRLGGRDEQALADSASRTSRRGVTKLLLGSNAKDRVIRSVVWMEGLQLEDGTVANRMTAGVYDEYADSWILKRIQKRVAELNGEDLDEEGE